MLNMKVGEYVNEYFARTLTIANKMRVHDEKMEDVVVIEKILRSMTPKFDYFVCSIEEFNDLDTFSIDINQEEEDEVVVDLEEEEEETKTKAHYVEASGKILLMAHADVKEVAKKSYGFLTQVATTICVIWKFKLQWLEDSSIEKTGEWTATISSSFEGGKIPKTFKPEAVNWTVYVLNRSLTLVVKDMTPEESWSGFKPLVDHFRVFSCISQVHIPDSKRTKLDDKSVTCVLLEVSEESKAYILYDPVSQKIIGKSDKGAVLVDTNRGNFEADHHDNTSEAMETLKEWTIYQLDVKSPFLHGELSEEVFVEQPPGMGKCNPVHNPMVPGFKLTKHGDGVRIDNTFYKKIVGSLMYLTATRLNVMFVVSLISRFMVCPTELHLQSAKRILRSSVLVLKEATCGLLVHYCN
ncbi:Retrovirus-related Pol polyprotein from transposon TNT 1-94 [Vitis vinifera]|uniref:Retrovirus-related Pol polyprotein from transposon TNT 1-94 n=1 Tax=Vitis vinifera TaxID=29760 RepID=A0A438EME0_VITVI|nr:Retrovirus-related Pol polyprotein from transposon TNT 1-94 [Vitis vinifera]